MGQHPLIDLSTEREVRQAKGFGKAASELTGEGIAAHYKQELANAPRRQDAGKRFFEQHTGKPPSARKNNRDEEHVGRALHRYCQENEKRLRLPRDGGELTLLDYAVPLQAAAPERERGDDDPNKGIGRADLLGVGPDNVLVVVKMRILPPEATRGGTGDTPLRHLLEGLAHAAVAEANRAAIQTELDEIGGPRLSQDPPMLILLASPRYWQLCRKREAQKGAAWIKEMDRLAREVAEEIGVQIVYLGLDLDGKPGWDYDEQGPMLPRDPALDPAWERNAGRLKPKSAAKPKQLTPADEIIEADLDRPIRNYSVRESFEPGERIQHPTLGLGVVQGGASSGKIRVRFDEERTSLLIHERGA